MRKLIMLAAAAALAGAAISPAQAQKLDKNGRCHAANGQFAKAEVCNGGRVARTPPAITTETRPAAAAPAARSTRCKNDRGQFAKCGTPGAHPAA